MILGFKKFFLFLLLIVSLFNLLFWVDDVLGENSTFTLSYPDFANPKETKSPAEFLNKFYLYALGISSALAIMMIVYGGVKYAVNPGNTANQSEARDIIKNAVFGIVLLAGAYLILKTINPSLVNLGNPQLKKIESEASSSTGDILNKKFIQFLASQLIGFAPQTDGECGLGTGARGVLQDIIDGKNPKVCFNGCKRQTGQCSPADSSVISNLENTLQKLLKAYDVIGWCKDNPTLCTNYIYLRDISSERSVQITSITGGDHSPNSLHYAGRAVDLIISGENYHVWNNVVRVFRDNGATRVFCEDTSAPAGQKQKSNCEDIFVNGRLKPGGHIHVEY